jgi:hypothetical protein
VDVEVKLQAILTSDAERFSFRIWLGRRVSGRENGSGERGVGREENCALLGCYAACGGNFLPTFRDNLSVPSSGVMYQRFLTPEECTGRLSRNVGQKLPLLAG